MRATFGHYQEVFSGWEQGLGVSRLFLNHEKVEVSGGVDAPGFCLGCRLAMYGGWRQWGNDIPCWARALAAPFREGQFVLRFLKYGGKPARELMESSPVLGWMAANGASFIKTRYMQEMWQWLLHLY